MRVDKEDKCEEIYIKKWESQIVNEKICQSLNVNI